MRKPVKRPESRTVRCDRCKTRIDRKDALLSFTGTKNSGENLCAGCYVQANPVVNPWNINWNRRRGWWQRMDAEEFVMGGQPRHWYNIFDDDL